jgi:O-antigen biosynthesis protein WbqP
MSLVGLRPELFNQEELTKARVDKSVFLFSPRITGLAKVSNMSTPELLAKTDARMISEVSSNN